jgi:hypothetical protein
MGKRCTRVKLVLRYFSLCTALLMWISRFTEWEILQKSSHHTFWICGAMSFFKIWYSTFWTVSFWSNHVSASSISPIIFESGNAARSTEGGRSGTAEARKPGFRSTEVLVQHRLAAYCTYVHVPRTVRPAIFFGVCKTVRSVVLRRGTKSVFAGAFCSVSRVRTEVHAHWSLFVHICLYVTYT